MAEAGIKELLEAGVHFGHQTRRWNPNMRRYIFGERDGIHIIDLLQTEQLLDDARRFAGELSSGGGTVLFVGTKKQARDSVKEWADRCQMPYVNLRWLGGLLTNFNTISARIKRLHELTELQSGGQLELLPDEGADGDAGRAGEARVQPRRGARYGAAARRRLRDRPEDRRDRGPRGRPAADPDHRPGRHQLRSGARRLRHPRQRRRDPLLRAGDRHGRRRDRRGGGRLARRGRAEAGRGGGAAPDRGRGAPQARGGGEGPPGGRGGRRQGEGGGGGSRSRRGGSAPRAAQPPQPAESTEEAAPAASGEGSEG